MRWAPLAALVGLLGTIAAPASAKPSQGIVYRCEGGETYGALADRYYGRRHVERHLRQLNRYPEPLPAGATIIIPTLRSVTVETAQSIRKFAQDHLQDEGRAKYLTALNGLKRSELKKGDRLLVPSNSLGHLVRRGETFVSIARNYYRSSSRRRVRLLRLYNQLPRGGLRPNNELRIPLDSSFFLAKRVRTRVRQWASTAGAPRPPTEAAPPRSPTTQLASSKRRRPSAPRPSKSPKTSPPPTDAKAELNLEAVQNAIETTERHMSDGRFRAALAAADDALETYDQTRVTRKVELLRLKAVALVALERSDEAKDTFLAMLRLEPTYRLDLYSTSPKVLEVFQSIEVRVD